MRAIHLVLFVTMVVAALAWLRGPTLDRLTVALAAGAAAAQAYESQRGGRRPE